MSIYVCTNIYLHRRKNVSQSHFRQPCTACVDAFRYSTNLSFIVPLLYFLVDYFFYTSQSFIPCSDLERTALLFLDVVMLKYYTYIYMAFNAIHYLFPDFVNISNLVQIICYNHDHCRLYM